LSGRDIPLGTGASFTLSLQANTTREICVKATNRFDNSSVSICRDFAPAPTTAAPAGAIQSPPVEQWLYSVLKVESAASFLNGAKLDINLNQGQSLPAGCDLVEVLGQELTIGGSNSGQPKGLPAAAVDHMNHGFTVSRTGHTFGDLSAFVHAWHDGFSAVRVRAAYRVLAPPGSSCAVPGVLQSTP
jgi:hypothetical protein